MRAHTQTIDWAAGLETHEQKRDTSGFAVARPSRRTARLLLALSGALAVLVGAASLSAAPGLDLYLHALLGSLGFVFLALAVEADRTQTALLLAATGTALPVLAWLASRVAPEFAVVGAAVLAAWLVAAGLRGGRALSA